MPRLPPLPDLDFNALEDGGVAPFARGHGDVYFSGEGLSEKRAVFLVGCGLPEGASSTIAGDFGSTVSRYCVSDRSSTRPPRSEIEPASRGVSIRTRGVAAITASRVAG